MRNVQRKSRDKKIFFLLWILCIVGTWCILPYLRYLEMIPPSLSNLHLFFIVTIQAALFYALICFLSYKILPRTDLDPFQTNTPLRQILLGLVGGFVVGFGIFFLDQWIFNSSLLSGVHPPFQIGLIASFYGAINEEVLLRLFLLTLVYFLLCKIFKHAARHRAALLWISTVLVAILFGLGHLPAAMKLVAPTSFEISRIILLNSFAGVVFGYLYWTNSLWAAMLAHFLADILIHVLLA